MREFWSVGFAGAPPEQIAEMNALMETAPINRPGDDVLRVNFNSGSLSGINQGGGYVQPIAVDYVKYKKLPLTIIDEDAWPDLLKRMR